MKTNAQKKGFTLVQTVVCCALLMILAEMITIGANGMIGTATQSYNTTRAASLNFAMDQYRTYLSDGYAPASGWSAGDEAGVIAELRKPLNKYDESGTVAVASVQVVSDTQFTEAATANGVKPTDLTVNCSWTAGD